VLAPVRESLELAEPIGSSLTLGAQVRYALREEMAMTLADVVFRRTDLATAEHPGRAALDRCAAIVREELGLSAARIEAQRDEVERRFPAHVPIRSEA
jgi:glycerol-3-phosphate dehydrogenase